MKNDTLNLAGKHLSKSMTRRRFLIRATAASGATIAGFLFIKPSITTLKIPTVYAQVSGIPPQATKPDPTTVTGANQPLFQVGDIVILQDPKLPDLNGIVAHVEAVNFQSQKDVWTYDIRLANGHLLIIDEEFLIHH